MDTPSSESAAPRCDVKGCGDVATERIREVEMNHLTIPVCARHAFALTLGDFYERIDHYPTQRVEATTTPEGGEGWETGQARHVDPARGHGVDVAPDPQPEGARAETRRLNEGTGGEPGNSPAADSAAAAYHAVQGDVEAFHRALDIPVGDSPAIRRPELRAELIREEARETVEAIERGDLIEAIDGLCDLLCVTYGAAAEFGINLAPFWDEVHRTNMAKVGGPVREDGKRLKPEGWTPPDIAGVLQQEWRHLMGDDGTGHCRGCGKTLDHIDAVKP